MSGTTVQWLGPGNWSATPAQPPAQQYDQWGRPTSGPGPGLGNLYNAVSGAMAQQQTPPNAPNLMGIGSSGYDQWGRQAPQGPSGPAALDPMSQSLVNAIGSGQPGQGAMLAQILAGVPEGQVQRGGGYGLLGAAAGGGRAEEAGGGMAGVESSASDVSSDPNAGAAEQAAGADTSNEEDR